MRRAMVSRSEELAAEIVIGADGFLFNLFEKAIEQICEGSLPDDRFLSRWVSLLETRQAWCAARGIGYVTLITPARHAIYDDKLPSALSASPNRAAMRLLRSIAPALRACVLYPQDELRAGRASDEVFLRTDEHMNDFGAYICYRAILRAIGPALRMAPVDIESFAASKRRLVGNLGIRLAGEPSEQTTMLDLPGRLPPLAGIRNKKGDRGIDVFRNEDKRLPSAIVFGDSNLHTLLPFLQPHFSRILSLPANQRFYFDLVRSDSPDVVINFISELTLGHEAAGLAAAPIDNDVADFVDYCEEIAPRASRAPLIAIDFSRNGSAAHFTRQGWSHTEDRHTWMIGAESVFELPPLPVDAAQAQLVTVEIELFPFLAPGRTGVRDWRSASRSRTSGATLAILESWANRRSARRSRSAKFRAKNPGGSSFPTPMASRRPASATARIVAFCRSRCAILRSESMRGMEITRSPAFSTRY
jgi:SGNH hydrolase-like domain, acetyltransferase AlgX